MDTQTAHKKMPIVTFEGNKFTITGEVFPESFAWEKDGKPQHTDYLFNSTAKQGEGFLAMYEGIPVRVSLKMVVAKAKTRSQGTVPMGVADLLSKYRAEA